MELSINKNYSGIKSERSKLSVIITSILLGILVSTYFFPFEFTFLPKGLNTKVILAVFAVFILAVQFIRQSAVLINKELFPAIGIAVIFSIIGFISVEVNNSSDLSYANYWISFATWLLGAYTTIFVLELYHKTFNFKTLFHYLIAVCVVQCFLALLIDNNETVKTIVDRYISQDTVADVKFLNEVDRLYGIGAAIDVAGTRFSIILIGLCAILKNEFDGENRKSLILFYWFSFFVISVIGNMISRTTTVGLAMGLGYLLISSNIFKSDIRFSVLKSWGLIFMVSLFLLLLSIYFYNTNIDFREQLRFGFEGFFNWLETGVWTTGSTERLNSEMWRWPDSDDYQTWIIGKAQFANWFFAGTDIGYCRFIFYSGLLGLMTFSIFFIVNAWVCALKFPKYKLFFVFLLALTFIIWLKVSTDLFLIYALFYCMNNERKVAQ